MHVLQNHDNDYSYWQTDQSAGDGGLSELKHAADDGPDRSVLVDNSRQHQAAFNDIYAYDPASLDDYELDLDQQKSYQLK